MATDAVAAAEIDLLVSLLQVAIGQQHARPKELVEEECTAVTPAHQVTAGRNGEFWLGVSEIKATAVRSTVERAVPDQRRKSSDGNRGERRVERWQKLVTGERALDDAIEIRIGSSRAEAVAERNFDFNFRPQPSFAHHISKSSEQGRLAGDL